MDMQMLYLIVPLAPLFGAIVAGLFGRLIGRRGAHVVAIAGVAISFVASWVVFQDVLIGNTFNGSVYTWMALGNLRFEVGFLIDPLSAMMMLVVTFVSLMVHVYTIGYMRDDPGYQRFFSYISLFTFSMLMLVMSNNFLQLFFGWEAVGLVSYLLIGFWYTKESAIYAGLKAFLVNRVGDFGFILGIGLVLAYFGTLDYATVFVRAPALADTTITLLPGTPWLLMTVIGILLFIGAMGKSAQFPLHVWLPDSMEGPTPISALIHAATMVTAGIFMVARMSPLFELSDVALSFMMVIGAITALFMGLLGIVQNDIKRVIAYSTLSQLGYMTVALGASAYSVAVFHLMTHAFFKALLFLAAGSVIIAMHHNQDIRYMGGLKKYMPITWITALIGSLALIGTPFLSGFYSKESIIEAVKLSHLPGSDIAYWAVLAGVFVTAFYSFRMYFLVFHGKERFHQGHAHGNEPDPHLHDHHGGTPHETPWVITGPLLALALPSLAIGYMTIEPMLFGDFFGNAIYVSDRHPVMYELNQEFHGAVAMGLHAVMTLPFWLAVAGVALAALFYLKFPAIPAAIARRFKFVYQMLLNNYWVDELYSWVFAKGARALGGGLWRRGDQNVIDGIIVHGTARLVERLSRLLKAFQSGYIYHYAFAMLIGIFVLVTWFARLN
ncbi:MAG: NADH-quinone oxidoreductase subunit L [Thiobacillus sp.]|uniref:NADH-quinone oxidoreductase subunit L n=1 Tax=Thiobacillus sp. TaxID=924 RepID=UPI0028954FF8|nr:NADH-quinone oxidoreductase subunit L [Thiobacillus sp.]MDT3706599.1 NADH-quinone oxidoreductase subunit L [Thiobacillus sp.]